MKTLSMPYLPPRSTLGLLLSALLLVSAYGAAAFQGGNLALVRLDLPSEDALAPLARRGLEVFTQIYLPDGGIRLYVAADAALQDELEQQGYALKVLDEETRQASYYLVSGEAEELERIGQLGTVLDLTGRQALVRLANEQAKGALADMGLRLLPLHAHRLAEPRPASKALVPSAVLAADPLVWEMVGRVNSTTVNTYNGNLSGEWPVTVDGQPFTFTTRYTYATNFINKATRYVRDHLLSRGLAADYDYYYINGSQYRNVIGTQATQVQPGRIFLITAHLDSWSNNSNPNLTAPGSDDNASGSTGVMIAADILSQYAFGCTLRYAFFTGEEQGLYGSEDYAYQVSGEDIEGVLNLDMIGYNTPGTPRTLELHTRPGNSSDLAIANLFTSAVSMYLINLIPQTLQDGESFSDHASFWNHGFPAILAIEDWNDHTPYYHRAADQLESLDLDYYTEFVKAAVATFAHMGCLLEGQLQGTVRDAVTGNPLAGARVDAVSSSGVIRTVYTPANGGYSMVVPPGSYSITASANDYLPGNYPAVAVNHNQTSTQDFSLSWACTTVSGPWFSFDPWLAGIGQPVNFDATVAGGSLPVSYSWDFGDGAIGSGQATSHSYAASGSYRVTLTANNTCGAPASVTRIVHVNVSLMYFPHLRK